MANHSPTRPVRCSAYSTWSPRRGEANGRRTHFPNESTPPSARIPATDSSKTPTGQGLTGSGAAGPGPGVAVLGGPVEDPGNLLVAHLLEVLVPLSHRVEGVGRGQDHQLVGLLRQVRDGLARRDGDRQDDLPGAGRPQIG